MPRPIILGTPASCGHLTGGPPSTVTVNGIPVALVGVNLAGGLIAGPGSTISKVLVDNIPVSLVGDFITPHGDGAHTAASYLTSLAVNVNIGPPA